MSYCRWGADSSVYVYEHVNGGWECCDCCRVPTREAMLEHLLQHQRDGDMVPEYAIDSLREEIKEHAALAQGGGQ